MNIDDERIKDAVSRTEILRLPRQSLATFGTTNIHYYLVTEPVYSEMVGKVTETVVREGKVIAERPRIVTPYYLSHLEGFSTEARRYLDTLIRAYGANSPGLFYTYKNEPATLNIVSDSFMAVISRINEEIDKRGDPLVSIIKGEDSLWDVSLMKFIYELTRTSVMSNFNQMNNRGLLNMDSSGVPLDARLRIDELMQQVYKGEREPSELKEELDRWGLFDEYEDRFYRIFRKKG